VSSGGGLFPTWRADGKEIYFKTDAFNGTLMAAPVRANGSALEIGAPVRLFDEPGAPSVHQGGPPKNYLPAADGQRFLMVTSGIDGRSVTSRSDVSVVLNWTQALKK
jgi:hypothetical protein